MKNFIKYTLAVASLVLVAACGGGGGGGGGGGVSTGFTQNYVASASQGEVITYSVNTTAMTYEYKVIKSQYGCEVPTSNCHSGSGTLTRNSDGTYTPSGSADARIFALQNGLLVGTIKLGTMPATPLIGIPNPIDNAEKLAGTYNYNSIQCPSKSNGMMTGCSGGHGSLTISAVSATTISYNICVSADIENLNRVCSSTSTGTGTLDPVYKKWKFYRTGSTQENYAVAFNANNNQKVAFLDFNDPGGYGYGQAALSEKVAAVPADLEKNLGRWFMVSLAPGRNSGYAVITVERDGGIRTVQPDGSISNTTAIPNTPWNGFFSLSTDPNNRGLMAGDGLFSMTSPNDLGGNAKYFIGMKMD